MAVFAIGAAATAAMMAGAYGISRIDKSVKSQKLASASGPSGPSGPSGESAYIYDASQAKRERDEYGLKHSYYEANYASPAWDDQEWAWDCKASGTCDGVAGGAQPGRAPKYGEHIPRPVGVIGDALSEVSWGTGRDASTLLELAPERTKTYTAHPLDFGGQLGAEEIPYGAQEATDMQFWGPTNWDAERNSRMPSYMDNSAMELNGKEINRPANTYGEQTFAHDADFTDEGAEAMSSADGQTSARTTNVRLQARNHYGSFVTTKEEKRPKFLPPTRSHAAGGGAPGIEPDITFGARLNKVFSAFAGGRTRQAPPEMAESTLAKSRRITINLPMGLAKPRIAATGSLDINPYDGYHYTSRETQFTWENNAMGKSRAGKNAYMLMGDAQLEHRSRKAQDDLEGYQAPRSAARGSIYGGEAAHGISFPNVKSSAVSDYLTGRGGRNTLGSNGLITLNANMIHGLKGGDYDDTPETRRDLIDLRTPRSVAIVGGRSKEALDDLFDVKVS